MLELNSGTCRLNQWQTNGTRRMSSGEGYLVSVPANELVITISIRVVESAMVEHLLAISVFKPIFIGKIFRCD